MTPDAGQRDALPPRAYLPMLGWAAADGTRVALIEGTRRMSYAALAQASERAATRLAARGVRPGDRVLVVAENVIVPDLPLGATGKVARSRLAEMAANLD